jgi:hypothetical protein
MGWVIETLEAKVGQFILGCKFPVSWGMVMYEQGSLNDHPAAFFFNISFNWASRDE